MDFLFIIRFSWPGNLIFLWEDNDLKKNESSLTSLISAFGRAYHHKYDTPQIFDDYIANDLMTQKEFEDISENMANGIQFFNPEIAETFQDQPHEILKWITQVQLSPTPLARAAFCENVLCHEMELGVKQYVILGAGMDTFCFRNPEAAGSLEMFEVDEPATQDFKKTRIANANYDIPDHLHFVPGDFTRDIILKNLVEQGFNVNKKTFFSLLGVSYYLTREETSALINELFKEVPSGSSIVLDYADENLFNEKGLSNRVQNMVQMAAASGEPMKSCYSYDEMEKMLDQSGLLIYEHLSPNMIQIQFFGERSDYLSAFETIHYIHAVKK